VTEPNLAVRLPDISTLRRRCQALAMLDAILCPEREYRYYSYDQALAPGRRLASMHDGSGNEYSIVFSPTGAEIRGTAQRDEGPPATVALWRGRADDRWQGEADPDAEAMFEVLVAGTPEAYHRFAQDYFEVGLDLDAVARVFAHSPLTGELVHRLTRHAQVEDLIDDCATIGWALSGRVPANH